MALALVCTKLYYNSCYEASRCSIYDISNRTHTVLSRGLYFFSQLRGFSEMFITSRLCKEMHFNCVSRMFASWKTEFLSVPSKLQVLSIGPTNTACAPKLDKNPTTQPPYSILENQCKTTVLLVLPSMAPFLSTPPAANGAGTVSIFWSSYTEIGELS